MRSVRFAFHASDDLVLISWSFRQSRGSRRLLQSLDSRAFRGCVEAHDRDLRMRLLHVTAPSSGLRSIIGMRYRAARLCLFACRHRDPFAAVCRPSATRGRPAHSPASVRAPRGRPDCPRRGGSDRLPMGRSSTLLGRRSRCYCAAAVLDIHPSRAGCPARSGPSNRRGPAPSRATRASALPGLARRLSDDGGRERSSKSLPSRDGSPSGEADPVALRDRAAVSSARRGC